MQEDTTSKGRHATVYDAVAGKILEVRASLGLPTNFEVGRLNASGFIPKQVLISSTRDTASSSTTAVPPEAVLFRRKDAPTRFAESDIYFANERELRTELPESDLLKALHRYTSDFYSRTIANNGMLDYRSLDETALIALGILMEEAARATLGRSGDLVFTEGEEVQVFSNRKAGHASSGCATAGRPKKRRRVREDQNIESSDNGEP